MGHNPEQGYKYRIAFGAWINDMRNDPLPLEQWPASPFDDETIDSAIRAMDVQSEAGFEYLDAWGLFATYGWPPDIVSAVDKDRRRRLHQLFKAAKARHMKILLGLGLMTWGYDKIIEAHPEIRGVDASGKPHPHAMCGSKEEAWKYVFKILDFALGEFDFAGVHVESCDLGWCDCPECAGRDGLPGYGCRINARCADYIKSKWPEKIVTVIPINWLNLAMAQEKRNHFSPKEQEQIIDLSRHINCFMDQGWGGTMIDPKERSDFVKRLHCDYGTSCGLWLYPDTRWDRASYFIPYAKRSAAAIRSHYEDGVRACMIYQGPAANPAQEVMMAFNGRMVSDVRRDPERTLHEVIERFYKPKNAQALQRLASVFTQLEDAYFGEKTAPGEFKVDQHLFGLTPGPAVYLAEPMLDDAGRAAYKKGLVAALKDVDGMRNEFDDHGRVEKIRRSLIVTLQMLNTVQYLKGKYAPNEI